jgi:hypothetical protein
MKKYNSVFLKAAVLLCWLCWAVVGVATPARREVYGGQKPPAQDNRRRPEMRGQAGQMELSMMTLNNLLAMSYLQNIATYARLLRDHVQQCGSVDGEFARDVVAEIWRNFDRLDCYRQEQMNMTQGGMRTAPMRDHSSMASMAANAPSEYLALREIGAERGSLTPPSPAVEGNQMTDMMRRMETCLTRLSARLIELERETGAANPNPKWVLEHTNAILRLLDEMSTTRGGSPAAR